ncbi:MAG: DUF4160 domain-containing protein [Lachnospiraceae bacterium]|nr:DUF4160 domain-containing protein [Lachnospiraceae bacterium]
MPEISLFYGIKVTMYYDDYNPPHFHAEYNGNKIIVDIIKGKVIKGGFPSKQLKLILAWDVAGNRNESKCIDIDPDTLYNLPESVERIA